MARYKAIKPIFENSKETQVKRNAKRNGRILRTFSYCFVAILIFGIILTGANYDNDLIFGWGCVIMGVVSLLGITFIAYTEIKGWYNEYVYWKKRKILGDSYIDKEELKKDVAEHRFVMIFIGIVFLCLTVYMFVLGFRALLGIR